LTLGPRSIFEYPIVKVRHHPCVSRFSNGMLLL